MRAQYHDTEEEWKKPSWRKGSFSLHLWLLLVKLTERFCLYFPQYQTQNSNIEYETIWSSMRLWWEILKRITQLASYLLDSWRKLGDRVHSIEKLIDNTKLINQCKEAWVTTSNHVYQPLEVQSMEDWSSYQGERGSSQSKGTERIDIVNSHLRIWYMRMEEVANSVKSHGHKMRNKWTRSYLSHGYHIGCQQIPIPSKLRLSTLNFEYGIWEGK